MDVNNKGFPNETQNRKHSILKIVYMLAIMLMATSGFIMVSSDTIAKAWDCEGKGTYTHSFSSGCPGQSVRCSNTNSSGTRCSKYGTGTGSHSAGSSVSYDETYHWYTCTKCSTTMNKSSHSYTYTNYSSNGDGTHTPSKRTCWCGDSDTSSTINWASHKGNCNTSGSGGACSICGYKAVTHTHSYSSATCTKPPTCSCGATNGNKINHADTNGDGKCDMCNNCMEDATTGSHAWIWETVDNNTCKRTRCRVCQKVAQNSTNYPNFANPQNHDFSGNSNTCKRCLYSKDDEHTGKSCTYHKCGGLSNCGCTAVGTEANSCWFDLGDNAWVHNAGDSYTVTFIGCVGHSCSGQSKTAVLSVTDYRRQNIATFPHNKTDCIQKVTPIKSTEVKFSCNYCAGGHTYAIQIDGSQIEEKKTTTKKDKTWQADGIGNHSKWTWVTCTNCNSTWTEGITTEACGSWKYAKASHTYESVSTNPQAPAFADGIYLSAEEQKTTHIKYCGKCGYHKTEPHSFGSWSGYSTTATTHSRSRTCSLCGYKETETNNHDAGTNNSLGKTRTGDWTQGNETNHTAKATETFKKCNTCGYQKAANTNATIEEAHNSNGRNTASTWSSDAGNHWKNVALYCTVCSRSRGSTTESYGSHKNWTNRHNESGWSKGASSSTRTYYMNCGVCGYEKQFTETCKHDGSTNASWKYGDWNVPTWTVATSSTADTPSTRTKTRTCAGCGYVDSSNETCNHTGTNGYASWVYGSWSVATASTADTPSTRNKTRTCKTCNYIQKGTDTCKHDGSTDASWKYGAWEYKKANGTATAWVVGTSSTANTPSTRDKRRVCAGCNYINLSTNTCKHDGNTDGLKYGNWTPTAPGTWNEGEAQSTRPQTRSCGCGYTQKSTETCNHNGTPSGSHIVYDKITNNDVQHTKRCSYCTWNKLDNHIWKDNATNNGWKQGDASNHTRECSLCGYIETKPHNWGNWVQYETPANAFKHQSTCADCKRTKTENHKFTGTTTWDNSDTGYHYDKCQTTTCGYIRKEQHILSQWSNDNPSDNNQVVPSLTGTHTHHCTQQSYGTGCGYTRTEAHNWVKVATDKPGFSKYQCSSTGCGAIQYTTNYYKVKFLPNGGSPNTIAEQTVTYTEGVALTEMTRTGYTFKGWQKYSGADNNNNTNTDPLLNGNTEYFRFATNMLAGYNDNNMVVTLIAIWQHDHPTDTVDKVSITGGVSANASNPSGIGTAYYCNPKSTYTVTQRTVNNTSPYYVSSNGIEVIGASSGITLENATDFADSQTVAGEFIVHTLTSNATIKSTNNDGIIKLQPYSVRTCNWSDTTRSCTTCKNIRTNGNQTALMFDGNAPLEDTINNLIADWESPTGMDYHYEQLNGRTLTIKATDIIGTYYSGLDASVCSIVLEGSDGSTRTLSKTPTTDTYGRITDYTFETFTIDETTPFFADGFRIIWNFTDRVGNNSPTSKGSYRFNGFTVGITEFGSYTYQTETSAFTKGEAVYVKIRTTGYTDALNIKVPYDNVQYVYYTDKTDAFVLENAHTENLVTNASNTIDIMSYKNSGGVNRPGYINIDTTFGDDKPEHEFYFIFIIPEDSTNTTGTVTVTGTKKALGTTMTKTDSRNFTIDTSTYITEGLHTIIRRTN